MYWPNDSPVLFRDDGSGFSPWGPVWKFTPPPAVAGWTQVNFGAAPAGAYAQDRPYGIVLYNLSSSGSEFHRAIVRAVPTPAPWTLTAGFLPTFWAQIGWASAGIVLRESSSGKMIAWTVMNTGGASTGAFLSLDKVTNPTTFGSTYDRRAAIAFPGAVAWLRLTDDGTNYHWWQSADGFNWVEQFRKSRTDYLTADQVGFTANNGIGNTPAANGGFPSELYVTLLSWAVS